MFLIFPVRQGRRMRVKGFGRFRLYWFKLTSEVGELGDEGMALKFCDDTLKEGMFGSETSKGPA
jgi:hypothetical protein